MTLHRNVGFDVSISWHGIPLYELKVKRFQYVVLESDHSCSELGDQCGSDQCLRSCSICKLDPAFPDL